MELIIIDNTVVDCDFDGSGPVAVTGPAHCYPLYCYTGTGYADNGFAQAHSGNIYNTFETFTQAESLFIPYFICLFAILGIIFGLKLARSF